MKKITLCLLFSAIAFAGASFSFAHKETNTSVRLVVTSDPRPPICRTFSLGKESRQSLHEMTLIIAWSPTQKGLTEKSGYQIWGDERILSKKQLTHSLGALYRAQGALKGSRPRPLRGTRAAFKRAQAQALKIAQAQDLKAPQAQALRRPKGALKGPGRPSKGPGPGS